MSETKSITIKFPIRILEMVRDLEKWNQNLVNGEIISLSTSEVIGKCIFNEWKMFERDHVSQEKAYKRMQKREHEDRLKHEDQERKKQIKKEHESKCQSKK